MCLEKIVAKTSSVTRHFDAKHKDGLKHLNEDELQAFLRKKI